MIKILTIIGARPQIIKASALSRKIRDKFAEEIDEVIVHTGQHYDNNMSEVFFNELNIPSPKYNLAVGSDSHAKQTAKMIDGIERVLFQEEPQAIVLYGDTNSTLAGAIAASKIHIPIVHIEAGLRSFDKRMPEEINRIMCDHVSTLLFSPTTAGYNNLVREGFSIEQHLQPTANKPNIYHSGDIMLDNTLFFLQKAKEKYGNLNTHGDNFILCTIHRNTNTDNKDRLQSIFNALMYISQKEKIVLPLHPRTKKMLYSMFDSVYLKSLEANDNIDIIEPVSFLQMTLLESLAKVIITDSGGVQKEAYYLEKPCVILREQTEWVEIVESKNAAIADADFEKIVFTVQNYINNPPKNYPKIFGDGNASEFICNEIKNKLH
ncbi:MAG: UDP-N-acetylglucosamine 2-epimerase (non-hydrolyzing) [Bacteroidales bacterium]|jgi:UDP-GlcNAc3NAcA epimerase|nr:UDP-N-acetylglucosamine 2-epimerase (non-hydrolyzing) [Bacteroidales bacterium]